MVGADRGALETSPAEHVRAYLLRGMCHAGEKRDACPACQKSLAAARAFDEALLQRGIDSARATAQAIVAVADTIVAVADTLGAQAAIDQAREDTVHVRNVDPRPIEHASDRASGRQPIPEPWPDSPDGKYAARRLEAFSAQVSQAGRVLQVARALVNPLAGVGDADADRGRLRRAFEDYDRAAERVAAIDAEGSAR